MASSTKGNIVSLKTFESWGKSDIFGRTVTIIEGREMVNLMWCKLCAKYKKEISQHLKGVALTSALAMANGTNYVAKYSVSTYLFFSFSLFIIIIILRDHLKILSYLETID